MQGGDAFQDWDDSLDGEHLTNDPNYRKVHFGFRDLIAQPAIRGLHPQKNKMHEPGEFLLGYRNDHGFNPWLLIDPASLLERWLPLSAAERKFFLNGSFAALRKMEQDEAEFRAQIKGWCDTHEVGEEYIKAKIVGRWADGRLIQPGEMEPPKGQPPADLDDFDFAHDREGLGCPFGSHVRRMNPREDRVVPARKRTLIRRGMPYGPLFDKRPNEKRGLLGLFFCASLEDQFEHLVGEWGDANPMGPPNRGTAKDPFIGSDQAGIFDIPMPGDELRPLDGFKPFVTTRGTLYAFFPSMAALRAIASGKACA